MAGAKESSKVTIDFWLEQTCGWCCYGQGTGSHMEISLMDYVSRYH